MKVPLPLNTTNTIGLEDFINQIKRVTIILDDVIHTIQLAISDGKNITENIMDDIIHDFDLQPMLQCFRQFFANAQKHSENVMNQLNKSVMALSKTIDKYAEILLIVVHVVGGILLLMTILAVLIIIHHVYRVVRDHLLPKPGMIGSFSPPWNVITITASISLTFFLS